HGTARRRLAPERPLVVHARGGDLQRAAVQSEEFLGSGRGDVDWTALIGGADVSSLELLRRSGGYSDSAVHHRDAEDVLDDARLHLPQSLRSDRLGRAAA